MNGLAVAIGGFLGAILRYALGEWMAIESFPLGTLLVNLLGCLFLGWFLTITVLRWSLHPSIRSGVATGLIGSFTTFSTFSVETVQLLQDRELGPAVLYVFISLVVGMLFTALGIKAGKRQGHKMTKGGIS